TDNQLCVFGERKKAHDKVYPKGYVEMLEQQQHKIVNALHEMYNLVERKEPWPGQPLNRTTKGYPLTHDILDRLGLLKLKPEESEEPFEEDTNILLNKMSVKQEPNGYPTPIQTDFSPTTSEPTDVFSPPLGNDMALPLDQFPPPPPSRTPEERLIDPGNQYGWPQPPIGYSEGLNMFPTYNPPQTYNGLGIARDGLDTCLPPYNDEFNYATFNAELT
ncbi:Fluconazole resistance protein 1, partial [Lecanora helva]